jgi:hypothetical protein
VVLGLGCAHSPPSLPNGISKQKSSVKMVSGVSNRALGTGDGLGTPDNMGHVWTKEAFGAREGGG